MLAQPPGITSFSHRDVTTIVSSLGGVYENYKTFQPVIEGVHGYVPFPAVGTYTTSGGLKIVGARKGLCSKSDAQVYVRRKDYPEIKVGGIIHANYFAKDQDVAGLTGHRLAWEKVVKRVMWDWSAPVYASTSGHGDCTSTP